MPLPPGLKMPEMPRHAVPATLDVRDGTSCRPGCGLQCARRIPPIALPNCMRGDRIPASVSNSDTRTAPALSKFIASASIPRATHIERLADPRAAVRARGMEIDRSRNAHRSGADRYSLPGSAARLSQRRQAVHRDHLPTLKSRNIGARGAAVLWTGLVTFEPSSQTNFRNDGGQPVENHVRKRDSRTRSVEPGHLLLQSRRDPSRLWPGEDSLGQRRARGSASAMWARAAASCCPLRSQSCSALF